MAISTSWIHGNALTIEKPVTLDANGRETGRFVLTPFGWGTQVSTEGNPLQGSWFHLPIPTIIPPLSKQEGLKLNRVFLLFSCSHAQVSALHIYDNDSRIQEFNSLKLTGDLLQMKIQNTFEVFANPELKTPYRVKGGIGLSFLLATEMLLDRPGETTNPMLMVASAGAEFETYTAFPRPEQGGGTYEARPPM